MWTEVQADSETICNSSDRTSQWEQILRIAWRVVANVNGVSYNRPWVLQSLLVLDDALGPGNLLSDEQIEAYMAAGPLLDYAYLMLRCAEKMTSHERAQLDADLFRKIIGNSGGIWSLWFDRLEIRDGFPWDHIFGNAVYLCDDAHVLVLRLLSAMLLCLPLHSIKQAVSFPPGDDPMSPTKFNSREDNQCLVLRNRLRLNFGQVDIHAKLKDITDANLLARWQDARYVFNFLLYEVERYF
ncbi:hypothetical protein PMIN06_004779 [Paraphaeosphaeria minitans]